MKEIVRHEERIQVGSIEIAISRMGRGQPVLCFHGWLDNAASFYPLVDLLGFVDCEFILVDFPGHGLSDHHAGSQHFVDLVAFVFHLYGALGIQKATLIGHSMGAGACSLFAGAFPDMVSRLYLIDGLGPLSDPVDNVVERLRSSLLQESKSKVVKNRIYKDLKMAINVRMKVGPLSRSSATVLVERGMLQVDGGYVWNYDPRLKAPSLVRFVEEQVQEFLKNISCPTTLFLACDSQPNHYHHVMNSRCQFLSSVAIHHVTGGHHLHMENASFVADVIRGDSLL